MRTITAILLIGCMTLMYAQEPTEDRFLDENVNADQKQLSEQQINEKPVSFWMEKKLDYSSGILRGLASEDYDEITNNGMRMLRLNKVEGFVRRRNPEYRAILHTFERLTTELIEQADKKNIDGVALAFNQLTVSCVRCHQTLRKHESSVDREVDNATAEEIP